MRLGLLVAASPVFLYIGWLVSGAIREYGTPRQIERNNKQQKEEFEDARTESIRFQAQWKERDRIGNERPQHREVHEESETGSDE